MMDKIDWSNINKNIYENLDRIIEAFNLDLRPDNLGLVGCCPIHEGSDNPTAFRIYPTGSWWCYTRHCADGQSSLIHLLKLLLEKEFNIECGLFHAVTWYLDNIADSDDRLNIPKSVHDKTAVKHIPKVFFEDRYAWRKFASVPSTAYKQLGFTQKNH